MLILETDRLLFRDHELGDLDAYCAMEADPEVRRFVGGQPRSREAAEEKFRRVYLPPVPDRLALWATVYKPEQVYIGYCGLYGHFGPDGGLIPGEGTLGFYLARPYWNRGLATEAGRAFVDFGFRELNMTKIVAVAQIDNVTSIRVLEKLGLRCVETEVGERRSYYRYEVVKNVASNDDSG
jgi:ribosomal-protein-alanine N-acetyltransferase